MLSPTDLLGTKSGPQDFHSAGLYGDLPSIGGTTNSHMTPMQTMTPRITSAPDVEAPDYGPKPPVVAAPNPVVKELVKAVESEVRAQEPTKRKYVKEAWPGRKPKGQNLLSV